MNLRRFVAMLLSLAALGGPAEARTTVLRRIRVVATASYDRIVLELSAPARWSAVSVPRAGERAVTGVVIDLDSAIVGPLADGVLAIEQGPLRRVAATQRAIDVARVSIDFRTKTDVRVFRLPDPDRLVIDVHGPAPATARGGVVRRFDTAEVVARRDTGLRRRAQTKLAARPPGASAATAPLPGPRRAGGRPAWPRPAEEERPAVERDSQDLVATAPPVTLKASLPPAAPPARRLRVMIDPGHGGRDPGALGTGGLAEKDLVLDVSRLLAERLGADPGLEVALTRRDDRFLSLEERTGLANAFDADVFVSIHGNASPNRATHGIEVYYLNNTDNRGTLRLAAMENGLRWDPNDGSLAKEIPDVSYIVSDLRQTYKVQESRLLAQRLGDAMVSRLGAGYDRIPQAAILEGPFYVLVGAYMPCVLVELSFLTNPVDGARLETAAYREALAQGIAEGIRRYVVETRVARNL